MDNTEHTEKDYEDFNKRVNNLIEQVVETIEKMPIDDEEKFKVHWATITHLFRGLLTSVQEEAKEKFLADAQYLFFSPPTIH